MSKAKFQCAVIVDTKGEIMVGTDGHILRIRRAGELPIEVHLLPCSTPKENLHRAEFDMDPLFHATEEMRAWIEEARARLDRQEKFGLKQSIRNALGSFKNGK